MAGKNIPLDVILSYIKEDEDGRYSLVRKETPLGKGYIHIHRDPLGYANKILIEKLEKLEERSIEDLIDILEGGLDTRAVSRMHAQIYPKDGEICFRDLGSLSGTLVYIPEKGLYGLYTPRHEYSRVPVRSELCIKPGERAILFLAMSSLEKDPSSIRKYESILSRKNGSRISLEKEGIYPEYTYRVFMVEIPDEYKEDRSIYDFMQSKSYKNLRFGSKLSLV